MSSNLFPELLDRPLRHFPNLLSNLLMNPTPNIFSEHLLTNLSQLGEARIYEEKDQLHVELPVPGLTLKDIDVTMKNGVLIVKGEAKEEEKDKKRKYYRSSSRSYSYSLSLPTQIDEKQEPHASYEHGILNISMKLAKASETKKITVKARNGKK